MPAPSRPTLAGFQLWHVLGPRLARSCIAFMLKKKVLIIVPRIVWPTISLRARWRALDAQWRWRSPPSAPSTMHSMMACGAGYRPRVCFLPSWPVPPTSMPAATLGFARRAAGHLVVLGGPTGCMGLGVGRLSRPALAGAGSRSCQPRPVRAPGLSSRASRGPNSLPSTRYGLRAHQAQQARHLGHRRWRRAAGPSVTSGMPNWIFGVVHRECGEWPTSATSQPPPKRGCRSGSATTGHAQRFHACGNSSSAASISAEALRAASSVGSAAASLPFRSAPAKEAWFWPRPGCMPLMALLVASAPVRRPRSRSCCHCTHMVLTGEPGSSKVSVAMPFGAQFVA